MALHVEGEENFENDDSGLAVVKRIGIIGCIVIIVGMLIACNSVQGAAPPPLPPSSSEQAITNMAAAVASEEARETEMEKFVDSRLNEFHANYMRQQIKGMVDEEKLMVRGVNQRHGELYLQTRAELEEVAFREEEEYVKQEGIRAKQEALQEYTVLLQEKNEEQARLVHEEQLIKLRSQQRRIAEVDWDVGQEAEERGRFVEAKRLEREDQARQYFRENYVQRVPQFKPQDESSAIGVEYQRGMDRLQGQFQREFEELYPAEEPKELYSSKPRAQSVDEDELMRREWHTTRVLVAFLALGCFVVAILITVDPPADALSACTCADTENGKGDLTILVNRQNMTITGTRGGISLQDQEQHRMHSPFVFILLCLAVAIITLAFFRWVLRLDLTEEEKEEKEEKEEEAFRATAIPSPIHIPAPTLTKRSLPPILRRTGRLPPPAEIPYEPRYGGGGGGGSDGVYAGERSSLRPHATRTSPIHSEGAPPSRAGLARLL
jgi:hypothetical protein